MIMIIMIIRRSPGRRSGGAEAEPPGEERRREPAAGGAEAAGEGSHTLYSTMTIYDILIYSTRVVRGRLGCGFSAAERSRKTDQPNEACCGRC